MFTRRKVALIAVSVAGIALPISSVSAGSALGPMTYPAQVEQGETFTISGSFCSGEGPGTADGGLDGVGSWGDISAQANSEGQWTATLTVPLDQAPGTFEWDVQCMNGGADPFYPLTTIEIVERQDGTTTTASTAPTTSSTTTTASTTTTTQAPNPPAPVNRPPTYTG